MNRILSFLLITALFGFVCSPTLTAQTTQTKQEKKAEKVKTKIKKLGSGESAKVKVTLYNETSYKGYVREAGDADFVVVDKGGTPHTAKYSDVKSIGGKNMSTGAKMGIGIGIGAGATILALLLIFASLDD